MAQKVVYHDQALGQHVGGEGGKRILFGRESTDGRGFSGSLLELEDPLSPMRSDQNLSKVSYSLGH